MSRFLNQFHPFCLVLIYFLLHASSSAKTIYVNQTAQPGGDGTSWDNAFTYLHYALPVATDGDSIWLAKGYYFPLVGPFSINSGVTLYGGFNGSEAAVEQRDAALNQTFIYGFWTYRLFVFDGVINSGLDGLTLLAGNTRSHNYSGHGGAIYCKNADSSNFIRNCRFIDNASDYGGAIYLKNSNIKIENCVFFRNEADYGGAIYVESGVGSFSRLDLFGNYAEYGGAIYSNDAEFIWDGCRIFDNNGLIGAGLFVQGSSTTTLANSLFLRNKANFQGGGISCSGGNLRVLNSVFDGNRAHYGGALFSEEPSGNWIQIVNCIFTANSTHAIFRFTAINAGRIINNLFLGNADADLWMYIPQTGFLHAGSLQLNQVPGFDGTIDGDPMFSHGPVRSWSEAPVYLEGQYAYLFVDASAEWQPHELTGGLIDLNPTTPSLSLIADNTTTAILVYTNDGNPPISTTHYRLLDYRLGQNSAAIDTGAPIAFKHDFDGFIRPIDVPESGADHTGTEIDLGPFEKRIPFDPRFFNTPSFVDFGEWDIAAVPSPPLTIPLFNNGTNALSFFAGSVQIQQDSGSHFSIFVPPSLDPLPPGEFREIPVIFHPETVGFKLADLRVYFNEVSCPSVIGLAGEGVVGLLIWIDALYSHSELGTFDQPFNTLSEAVAAVTVGGTIRIKSGALHETIRIQKRLRIEAPAGQVQIGIN